jgi:hypothetical protein
VDLTGCLPPPGVMGGARMLSAAACAAALTCLRMLFQLEMPPPPRRVDIRRPSLLPASSSSIQPSLANLWCMARAVSFSSWRRRRANPCASSRGSLRPWSWICEGWWLCSGRRRRPSVFACESPLSPEKPSLDSRRRSWWSSLPWRVMDAARPLGSGRCGREGLGVGAGDASMATHPDGGSGVRARRGGGGRRAAYMVSALADANVMSIGGGASGQRVWVGRWGRSWISPRLSAVAKRKWGRSSKVASEICQKSVLSGAVGRAAGHEPYLSTTRSSPCPGGMGGMGLPRRGNHLVQAGVGGQCGRAAGGRGSHLTSVQLM